VPTREIAEAIGRAFDLPVTSIAADDVAGHFGWIGNYFAMDLTATSTATRELLGWTPTGPTLIEDLDVGAYSARKPFSGPGTPPITENVDTLRPNSWLREPSARMHWMPHMWEVCVPPAGCGPA
jgi:hypothetical protein